MVVQPPTVLQGAHVRIASQIQKTETSRPETLEPVVRRFTTHHLSYWESSVKSLGLGEMEQQLFSVLNIFAGSKARWGFSSKFRIEETQQVLKALCWNLLLHICLFTCNRP